MSLYCSFCKKNTTHAIKNLKGEITCPVLLNVYCYQCKQKGHTPKCCPGIFKADAFPALITQETPKAPAVRAVTPPVSSWANVATKTCDSKLVEKIANEDKRIREEQLERDARLKAEKQARHEEWVKRKEERERIQEQQNIEKAMDHWGSRWYVYVEGTDLDCNLALKLRTDEEDRGYQWEEQMRESERKADEEYEHNKKTMTEEEFDAWMDEESEDYFNEGFHEDTLFTCYACPAASSHYYKTGMKRSASDFVSNEWGASLKPGLLVKKL